MVLLLQDMFQRTKSTPISAIDLALSVVKQRDLGRCHVLLNYKRNRAENNEHCIHVVRYFLAYKQYEIENKMLQIRTILCSKTEINNIFINKS